MLGDFDHFPTRKVIRDADIRDGAVQIAGSTENRVVMGGYQPVTGTIWRIGALVVLLHCVLDVRPKIRSAGNRIQGEHGQSGGIETNGVFTIEAEAIFEIQRVAAVAASIEFHGLS